MIKPRTFERILHWWLPWRNALERARQCEYQSADEWWDYARVTLNGLGLPDKHLMNLYFLSCVSSTYEFNGKPCFEFIHLPDYLGDKFQAFVSKIDEAYYRFNGILKLLGIKPIRLCPDLEDFRSRPLPPAVWTYSDVRFALRWESHHAEKPFEVIRTCYSPFSMMIPWEHPLWGLAYTAKREIDSSLALRCANLKLFRGYTYRDIGEEFGWPLQRNEYGKPTRCSRAQRYVRRGLEILLRSA